jgi:hypothetical protein
MQEQAAVPAVISLSISFAEKLRFAEGAKQPMQFCHRIHNQYIEMTTLSSACNDHRLALLSLSK